jgi:hypothetical protein
MKIVPAVIGDVVAVVKTTVSAPDIVSFILIVFPVEFTAIAYVLGCKFLSVTEKFIKSFPEVELLAGMALFIPNTAENGKV